MPAMVNSFAVSKAFVRKYVADGMAEVRRLQQQTIALVQRNAEEIRRSSLAAHNNRMRSMDYTDYLFTRYMRGEQDWISSMEGGRVFRSDNWGVKRLSDGRYVSPVDYLHFNGQTRYEQMTPIRTRRQFEQYILNG